MKSSSLLLLIGAALVGAATQVNAAYKLGSDSELFVTATAGVQYNDNILLTQNGTKSDTIFDAAPGLLAIWGQSSDVKGQASFSEDFSAYSSNSGLNSSLAKFDLTNKYDSGVSKVDFDGWFHQVDQATRDVRGAGTLVHRDLSHAALSGENEISSKTSIKLGFAYDNTDYKPVGYTDWQWYEIPLNYYYKVEPKLDVSAGIRYKDNQLGKGGIDSKEYYYNVGARGELAPKLIGEFSVGLNSRKLNGIGTKNEFGLESNFSYAYSPKTAFTFGANNDFGYSAGGGAYKTFGLNGGIDAAISSDLKVDGTLAYSRYSYSTTSQRDDYYTGQVSATYLLNGYVSLTGAYAYSDDSSNLAGASFKNNILSVSATFRY
jgi:hypothetical protein